VSSSSTQRPPRWVPVPAATQTLCFVFFTEPDACDADDDFKSKFSCVGWPDLVFALSIEAFMTPFRIKVTR